MEQLEEKVKVIKQILQTENINLLIQKLDEIISDKDFYRFNLLNEILDALRKSEQGQKKILDNFLKLLSSSFEEDTLYLLETTAEIPNGKSVIYNNLKQVYKKVDVADIPSMIEMLEDEAQESIYQENSFAYKLRERELIDDDVLGAIIKSRMSDFVKIMLDEISEGKEIKKLTTGTYSTVLETNGYVVKLGEAREKFEIPYHPNIIQPLLREEVKDEDGRTTFVAEIQPKVDTENVTKEHVEYIKQKLKESRIRYRDYGEADHTSNIGILIKPNKRYLSKGAGGIVESGVEEREAKPGEPVIIDLDLLERE